VIISSAGECSDDDDDDDDDDDAGGDAQCLRSSSVTCSSSIDIVAIQQWTCSVIRSF